MELVIDQFTQCLVDMQTGDTVDTVFSKASTQYLQALTGWAFDWCGSDLESAEIYKLSVSGNAEAEGLVALQYMERDHATSVPLSQTSDRQRLRSVYRFPCYAVRFLPVAHKPHDLDRKSVV